MSMDPRRAAEQVLLQVESLFNGLFGPAGNPLYHLGALTIFFFWVVLASGIYELIYFETSVFGAYESVEFMTREQWYLGGIMRSLHRYASDAAVITMALHLLRELIRDRYRGFRWFSWITGIPTLWLVIVLGISGYWLVWDQLAVYVAMVSSELLDGLPIFTDPMARNFMTEDGLSDRFFTLMGFIHLVGLPVVLLFAIWVHVKRITGPDINPPRRLVIGGLLMLLAVSLIKPAVSHEQAELSVMPTALHLDWFYLNVYPLLERWSPAAGWALLLGTTLALALLPWLPPQGRRPVAEVDPVLCNGCRRCFDDCFYEAVNMVPHPDGKPSKELAVVSSALCASCGICAGACPTSTPFRSVTDLVTAIDLPELRVHEIRTLSDAAIEGLSEAPKVLVYGCAHSADVSRLAGNGVAAVPLACTAQLSPAFIDFVLRKRDVAGVFVTGCQVGDCYFRLGNQWVDERLAGGREPHLRTRVDRTRVRTYWASAAETGRLAREVDAFREGLRTPGDAGPGPRRQPAGEGRPGSQAAGHG